MSNGIYTGPSRPMFIPPMPGFSPGEYRQQALEQAQRMKQQRAAAPAAPTTAPVTAQMTMPPAQQYTPWGGPATYQSPGWFGQQQQGVGPSGLPPGRRQLRPGDQGVGLSGLPGQQMRQPEWGPQQAPPRPGQGIGGWVTPPEQWTPGMQGKYAWQGGDPQRQAMVGKIDWSGAGATSAASKRQMIEDFMRTGKHPVTGQTVGGQPGQAPSGLPGAPGAPGAPGGPGQFGLAQNVGGLTEWARGMMEPGSDYYRRLMEQARGQIGGQAAAGQRAAALRGAWGGLGGGASPEAMATAADIGAAGMGAMGQVGAGLALQAPGMGAQALQQTFAPLMGMEQLGESSRQFGAGFGEQARQFGVGVGLQQQQMAQQMAQQQAQLQAQQQQWAMQQQMAAQQQAHEAAMQRAQQEYMMQQMAAQYGGFPGAAPTTGVGSLLGAR